MKPSETMKQRLSHSRRAFLRGAFAGVAMAAGDRFSVAAEPRPDDDDDKALFAITFDLEMSLNFPTWETTHWDYEKGNLNDATKR